MTSSRLPALFLTLLLSSFTALSVHAQGAATAVKAASSNSSAEISTNPSESIPNFTSIEEIYAYLATLPDSSARVVLTEKLLQAFKAKHGATRDEAHGGFAVLLVRVRKGIEHLSAKLNKHFAVLKDGFQASTKVVPLAWITIVGPSGTMSAISSLSLFCMIGIVVWLVARWAVRGTRARLESLTMLGIYGRFVRASLRAGLEIICIVIAALTLLALATAKAQFMSDHLQLSIAFGTALVVILLVWGISKTLLAPAAPNLRLLPLSNGAATFTHVAGVSTITIATILWLLTGFLVLTAKAYPPTVNLFTEHNSYLPIHFALVLGTGLIVTLISIVVIMIAGTVFNFNLQSSELVFLKRNWWWLISLYFLFVYCLWGYNILERNSTGVWPAVGSIALIFVLPIIDRVLIRALDVIFNLPNLTGVPRTAEDKAQLEDPSVTLERQIFEGEELRPGSEDSEVSDTTKLEQATVSVQEESKLDRDDEAAQEQRQRYREIMLRTIRFVITAFAFIALLEMWGIGPLVSASPETREMVWYALVQAIFGLLFTWVVWQIIKALIDPYLPEVRVSAGDEDSEAAPQTRTETLLPLLRATIAILLISIALMFTLSSFGVNIGPLLAGAGVLGIAIGFGAQALVKDIVSGVFFLIDDAFRIGEYIEFGELRGEVEAITLRSLKLRHHRGMVHTVPFGEILSITNYNRDWVIYKMEFRLALDTDIEKLRKLVKKLGLALMEDPEHGPKFIQQLKSQGITRVEENALIVRTKFMCKPREQFMLRRVIYTQLQELFKENGIKLAPRTVQVTNANDAESAAAGLASALDAEQESGKGTKDSR